MKFVFHLDFGKLLYFPQIFKQNYLKYFINIVSVAFLFVIKGLNSRCKTDPMKNKINKERINIVS